jgi:ribosomal protein S7
VYVYYKRSYEAHEPLDEQRREAGAERIIRQQSRARSDKRMRVQLAAAMKPLISARNQAARLSSSV